MAPKEEPEVLRAASNASALDPVHAAASSAQPELTTGLEVEVPRDAGGGKVRGPNGRYLPKDKPSPLSAKPGRKPSGIQKKKASGKFPPIGERSSTVVAIHATLHDLLLTCYSETYRISHVWSQYTSRHRPRE